LKLPIDEGNSAGRHGLAVHQPGLDGFDVDLVGDDRSGARRIALDRRIDDLLDVAVELPPVVRIALVDGLRARVAADQREEASANRSRTLVEEDRKSKRSFSRPLPPLQGSWPRLLWSLESASALERVDSAAQTRPSW